jgi:hypothetical protein
MLVVKTRHFIGEGEIYQPYLNIFLTSNKVYINKSIIKPADS